ncbi:MAG: cysteine--tRNA ligase [Legionellales bacterium]|nr:cysteine--tRNA ligase [Legionellales bacterium]OUX65726.1 MAG: cysteine--tRNA ligase [Gammaproteobacteria bacterium TMED281]|tara:strand:- start:265 stop:1614 length:1350 start_codon:yes stop_codon:yes gene_type:complete
MKDIYLYNSKSKKKELFKPIDVNHVKMYVCGPTVYARPHIGNARPRIVFDVLSRYFRVVFPNFTYVSNVTDVDDKINKAAQEGNISIKELTQKMLSHFHTDMSALNCLPPDLEVKATESMPEIIELIERLIKNGNAYVSDGHVLFSVATYTEYGSLSRRKLEEQVDGARVSVADYKKAPGDFVLWKPSSAPDPSWESPWGKGRPGWHIECTAMIAGHVGLPFDIHGGGIDLLFPHHENEMAQGCAAYQTKSYCNYWMHNGLINIDREKMSKSIGNVLYVDDLLEDAPGEAIRFAVLSTHYRHPLDWTDETLSIAKQSSRKLHLAKNYFPVKETTTHSQEILDCLADDLNTPKALSQLLVWAKATLNGDQKAHSLLCQGMRILGFGEVDIRSWQPKKTTITPEAIQQLIEERNIAKKSKSYEKADTIRSQLTEKGVVIEDTASETFWYWK